MCANNDIDHIIQVIKWGERKSVRAEILLRITSDCNLKCKYCFSAIKFGSIGKGRFKILLNELLKREGIEVGEVLFNITGGEPILNRDLFEILAILRESLSIYSINIQTNATLIDDRIAKRLFSINVKSAFVSVPSIREENYAFLTGLEGGLKKAIKGIHSLLNAGIKVCLNFVLSGVTKSEFIEIPNFVVDNFSRDVNVNLSTLSPGTPYEFFSEFGVDYKTAGGILEQVYHKLREQGIEYGSFGGDCSPPICAFESKEIREIFSFSSSDKYAKYLTEFTDLQEGHKYKSSICKKCKYDNKCPGVPYLYVKKFKDKNFNPIK
jgi:MoaA/NifB/PqqE/SkfB family radical SAM enzyme